MNLNKLPIVYVHKNLSKALLYSVGQTIKSNPESEVIILGDDSTVLDKKYGITYARLEDYSIEASKFDEYYVHMSPNDLKREAFCFERWLVLDEYLMTRDDIDAFVYLDSDVLLYANVSEYQKNVFPYYDLSVCRVHGPQYTFITKSVLHDFACYIIEWYRDTQKLEKLKDYYNREFVEGGRNGGVCDMTLLGWFAEQRKTFDTNTIIDGAIFENCINQSEDFIMADGIKKIEKIKDAYYGTLETGEKIRFNGLHFQGGAKCRMFKYYEGNTELVPSALYSILKLYAYKMIVFTQKVTKKLKDIRGFNNPIEGIKHFIWRNN